jgi:integrase/recombinase XerD
VQRLDSYPQVGQECRSDAIPWRATGITIYLENDGRLEHAQQMAGHESPRTTKLYDRTKDEITPSEVERIRL